MTTTVEDGCSDTRLTNVASMATSTAAAPTAELTLLIDGYLAGAIIGKGGSTLKSIKSASGVLTLQLSQESSVATRTVSVTGHAAALHEAYRLISQALRAEADPGEGRAFKIGDPVEARWIGDDALYPGTIEGHFTEGRYGVKWADPQGMADAQPTEEENIVPFEAAKYYRYGLGAWENGDVGTAYLCMRTVYICVGPFAKTEEYLEKLSIGETDAAPLGMQCTEEGGYTKVDGAMKAARARALAWRTLRSKHHEAAHECLSASELMRSLAPHEQSLPFFAAVAARLVKLTAKAGPAIVAAAAEELQVGHHGGRRRRQPPWRNARRFKFETPIKKQRGKVRRL